MKEKRSILVLLISVVLGLAVGSLFRKTRQALHNPINGLEASTAMGSNKQVRPTIQLSFTQQLERKLAKSKGVTRWLVWVDAVEKAPLELFPEMVELAKGDAGALRILAARWIDIDPRNLLRFLIRSNDRGATEILRESLFPEWAKRDPEAFIKEMEAPGAAEGPLREWRSSAAEQVTLYHPELGLPLFDRWSIAMTPSMGGVAKWAAENPQHAAEFTMKVREHFPATAAMRTIGEQWAKIDPAAAIAYGKSQQNSLGQTLSQSALKSWARQDLDKALEWLAKANETERNRLSAPVVEEWSKSEPAAALIWCEENLKGTRLSESATAVLHGAAEKDPWAAAQLVLGMLPSDARSAGAAAVAEKILPGRQETSGTASPEGLPG